MIEHRSTRRCALRRGLGTLAGVALGGVAQTARPAAAAKLAKTAVKYVDVGQDEGKDCDDCAQFVPGPRPEDVGTCKIVEGTINPHGHCIAFSPKPRK